MFFSSRRAFGLLVTCALHAVVAVEDVWYPYNEDHWANSVYKHNHICEDGVMQSPIDFPSCSTGVSRPAPELTWKTQSVTLINNGHTVELDVDRSQAGGPGVMKFDISGLTKEYELVQCHFHFGSEHQVGGVQLAFESHCVHALTGTEGDQRFGVFGVFWETGAAVNAFLASFEDELVSHPESVNKRRRMSSSGSNLLGRPMDTLTKRKLSATLETSTFTGPVNFTSLTEGLELTKYWNYAGSLTSPSCTEAVDWYVFMDKAQLTSAQLDKFKDAIGWKVAGGNFRPPEPIGSRTIYGCTVTPPPMEELPWYRYSGRRWATAVGAKSSKVCAGGSEQSPINFRKCHASAEQSAIAISWPSQVVELVNNGHTVQLTASTGGTMEANGKTYDLKQCHFHWGSEHTVGHEQFPFEAHCVHLERQTGETKHYGVFGQFYKLSTQANPFLNLFEDHLPAASDHRRLASVSFDTFGNPMDSYTKRRLSSNTVSSWTGPLNYEALYGLNSRTEYWNYKGSFTTPPCTEAVDFYILMEPALMTQAQLTKFKTAIGWQQAGGNFRPPQRLAGRTVDGCLQVETVEVLVDDSVAQTLPGKVNNLVRQVVQEEFANSLDSLQGNHLGMLIALVVLTVVSLLGLLGALAMAVLLVKELKASSAGTGSKAEPQTYGQVAGASPTEKVAGAGGTVEETI